MSTFKSVDAKAINANITLMILAFFIAHFANLTLIFPSADLQ
ncbi:hypothetical protein [Shewanella sp. HL-SH2]